MPPEPVSPLREGMVMLHELYLCARAAGFTDAQAMRMVVATMVSGQRPEC